MVPLAVCTVEAVSVALAHQPPGVSMRAVQFPDHLKPVIDGDLKDWGIVDPDYCVSTNQLTDLVSGAEVDLSDFPHHTLRWLE